VAFAALLICVILIGIAFVPIAIHCLKPTSSKGLPPLHPDIDKELFAINRRSLRLIGRLVGAIQGANTQIERIFARDGVHNDYIFSAIASNGICRRMFSSARLLCYC
jgi:hypothetical protein